MVRCITAIPHDVVLISVLVKFSIAVMKHQIYYISISQVIVERSQGQKEPGGGRKCCRDHRRVLLSAFLLMAFSLESRINSSGVSPHTVGWSLPHQSLTKKVPYTVGPSAQ